VAELLSYDYAVVRVVPRVEREEFLNVGVILSCEAANALVVRIELDVAQLTALAPDVDVELVQRHLRSIELVCAGGADAGPLGALPRRARFHWLTAVRSALIQTSPIHTGLCQNVEATLERLVQRSVRR
jgi:hypothetical protein